MAASTLFDLPPDLLAKAAKVPDLRLRLAQFIRGAVAQHSRRRGHIRPRAKALVREVLREADAGGPLPDDEQAAARGARQPASPNLEILRRLVAGGERIYILHFHFRHYPFDADDTLLLLTALNGDASHLVTCDDERFSAGVFYDSFKTCRPLDLLAGLRAASA